ncbi:MAG: DUF6338 family protein [Chloroflexota bacterium]
MPDTIHALLVILFAVLPGLPGNSLYQRLVGSDWREEQWRTVIRIIGISLGGLILYVIIGNWLNAPLPSYISPLTFANLTVSRLVLVPMAIAFVGHFVSSTAVGFLAAKITQLMDRWTKVSEYADSWHKFVSIHAEEHWVIVSLQGGSSYAGYIKKADTNVSSDERDIILAEPAVFRKDQNNYWSLPYKYLFIPGKHISSVAIVHEPSDERVSKIDQFLFSGHQPQGGKDA